MNSNARILIIEDELPMRTVLTDCLTRHGFRVFTAADGSAGLDRALTDAPDLILLDVMMPKLDGFALCAELRKLSFHAPILMLTAKGRVEDRVHGLNAGADDFLVKPFHREELLARVRALLRRTARTDGQKLTHAKLGDLNLDFAAFKAWRGTTEIHLTAKEFSMLQLLFETPGQCVSREKFLDIVWGYAAFPTTRTVDKHIAGLRAKVEANPDDPKWIQTVHGVGYRLELKDRS